MRFALIVSFSATYAAEPMPVARQNELVKTYCAVCHTDAARNGGLSLQGFDAAKAPPSLLAMLLSKLNNGAMGAAGIRLPEKASIDGLKAAFAAGAKGAHEWSIERTREGLVASTLRGAGEAELYRLIVSCREGKGAAQLTWSPVPRRGTLTIAVDGGAPMRYKVEGSEAMGNGSGVLLHEPASLKLDGPGFRLPAESLTVRDLFPGHAVVFSFGDLAHEARRELAACFIGGE